MSNLVLTVVSRLTASQMRPFVVSFQKYQENADLVLFTNCLDDVTRKYLSGVAKELVDFSFFSFRRRHFECLLWPICKPLFPRLSEASRRALARRVFDLPCLRFLLYLEYLESLVEKPQWIFLTDSRDAIFQDDLFARMKTPGLYVFGEGKGRAIASCRGNAWMMKQCAGQKAVEELGHCEPTCAGTILGDYESMLAYLQTTVRLTMSVLEMRLVATVDQGLHNYIVHKKLSPNIKFIDNDEGPIGTLGCVPADQIRESPEHLILQQDGRPYAFLHQQDRHKQIVANHPVYKQCLSC